MLLRNIILALLLLLAMDAVSSERVCSYQDVLNYLNLSKDNELFSLTRPVRDFRKPTNVSLELLLNAILDVRETDQTFIPYVWIHMEWQNDYISWDLRNFCGIENVTIPTSVMWKPDLTIEEMTEKDKAPPSPYLTITSSGRVVVYNDQVMVSTCKMQVYKFPFDVQHCTLSIKSVVHSVNEIRLFVLNNSSVNPNFSLHLMGMQYEWLLVNMIIATKTVTPFGPKQDMIIYTISMKRRSILYIVNFLLPVLFFLCLDLSSFLISDRSGEKISFKVTVLLAVTLMQLILNDILPSTSDKIPLIVVYCIGIFTLMFLSLLQTILMMYLMEIETESQDKEMDIIQSLLEDHEDSLGRDYNAQSYEEENKKWTMCECNWGLSTDKMPNKIVQGSSSQMSEQQQEFQNLSSELKKITKMLSLLIRNGNEKSKPGFWTRKIKIITKAYFILYVAASTSFLVYMFSAWTSQDE